MSDERVQWWVRLVTGTASTIVAAAIIWLASSVNHLQQDMAVVIDQLRGVRTDVQGVYTQADAKRDFGRVRDRLDDHEHRLRRLENGSAPPGR